MLDEFIYLVLLVTGGDMEFVLVGDASLIENSSSSLSGSNLLPALSMDVDDSVAIVSATSFLGL